MTLEIYLALTRAGVPGERAADVARAIKNAIERRFAFHEARLRVIGNATNYAKLVQAELEHQAAQSP